jgi:hypothetical protein
VDPVEQGSIIMADKQTKKTWKSSQTHLSQALEDWSTISQTVKVEAKVAPDQKMLKEIEGLLLELKTKLEVFSAPVISAPISEPMSAPVVNDPVSGPMETKVTEAETVSEEQTESFEESFDMIDAH